MFRRLGELLSLAGLSDDETRLYLLLLKSGATSAPQLQAETKMNVMTVYRTLKRLEDRGLLKVSPVNRKERMYKALSLHALVSTLESDERKIRRLQENLKKMTPFLKYLPTEPESGFDDPVELHEGPDAFREEYFKLPDCCTDEYISFGSMQNYWRVAGLSDFAPEEIAFRQKRLKRHTFATTLNTPSPESELFSKRDSRELRTTRLTANIPLKRDYMGFTDDRVCHFICDTSNPQVIVIRQPELLAMYRQQFRSIWDAGVVV
ncbi:MAG: helix-turn-helix domain-containing protein [Candidatus Peribacteraceae bacterium]|nr:helix-turn-helix domain-containing protein [Candidatus Peribacteraceae bacterium]